MKDDSNLPAETGGAPDEPVARPRRRGYAPLAFATVVAALLVAGIVPRLAASKALTRQVAAQADLSVSVVKPGAAPADQELLLPGSVMPFAEASIYARTSGYITHWYTDIGAKVTAGTTLATIETPELNAQLTQARADEQSAQANFSYAQSTAQRWQQMLKTQSVSQQDADTKVSDMQAKRAMLAAAQAEVARLQELVSYETVSAPFAGVVTARNVDVGALVTAGGTPGTGGSAGELFHVEQTDTLRVYVDVPQDDVPYVSAGTAVYLSTEQYPGRRFDATVSRTAGAIDPMSRTMKVEVDVNNSDGALVPGDYAQVHLLLANPHPALELPVSALLFRPGGVTVAVVGSDGKTALKRVTIGRDFGTYVEITTGLTAADRVINNPGDAITSAEPVKIESPTTPAPAAPATPG